LIHSRFLYCTGFPDPYSEKREDGTLRHRKASNTLNSAVCSRCHSLIRASASSTVEVFWRSLLNKPYDCLLRALHHVNTDTHPYSERDSNLVEYHPRLLNLSWHSPPTLGS
jgi:hypothetical protein